MAQTYTLGTTGVSFAANKSMIALFNGVGSGRIIRVYRIWALNNQVLAVTGVLTRLELRRITAASGGNVTTPIKHDSTSEALPAQIISGSAMTVTVESLFRAAVWSTDEPSANATASIDEFECIPAISTLWDAGYADTNVQPITLREGYGLSLQNIGSTVGIGDFFFEFTLASS